MTILPAEYTLNVIICKVLKLNCLCVGVGDILGYIVNYRSALTLSRATGYYKLKAIYKTQPCIGNNPKIRRIVNRIKVKSLSLVKFC